MNRIDWKPILLWGGGSGALLGLWAAVWVNGFILAWDQGWLHPGIDLPERFLELVRIPTEVSLAWMASALGLPPTIGLWSLLLWMTGFGAAAGAGVASVGRLLRLDPAMTGFRSFAWSLRAATTPMPVVVSLSMMGLAGATVELESLSYDGWLGWAALGLLASFWLLLWLLGIPILACREDIAKRSHAPRWWRPTWPGWVPVLIVLGIEALDHIPDWLLSLIDADSGVPPRIVVTAIVFQIAMGILLFVGPLVQCAVLMRLDGSLLGHWIRFFRWSTLGPWIALHGWWITAALVFAPPIAAVYVWTWKVVPTLATIHESVLEESLPYVHQLFINACNFIGNFWWLLFMVPVSFVFWFGTARFVALNREKVPGTHL